MTAVRDKLIANNKTINWIPESIGKGRFGDWLEHVQDWGLSRTVIGVLRLISGNVNAVINMQSVLSKN